MINPFALAGVLLVATPVFAQETADAGLPRLGDFVAVFQAQNCTLATKGEGSISEEALFALFAEAGFSADDVAVYASALIGSDRANVDKATDAVLILPPLCIVEANE